RRGSPLRRGAEDIGTILRRALPARRGGSRYVPIAFDRRSAESARGEVQSRLRGQNLRQSHRIHVWLFKRRSTSPRPSTFRKSITRSIRLVKKLCSVTISRAPRPIFC